MIDEITKNVTTITHILSNIGLLFLIFLMAHLIGPNPYFTPYAIYQLPYWIIGAMVGYCGRQLYNNYRNK